MKVEQISIFLENKPGGLEQVTRILKDAGINIRTLSLADTTDFGILRLIVNDVDTACRVLKENGFRFSRTNVVAVEVPDRPGGLHGILEVLSGNGINVEYMYAFVETKRRERRDDLPVRRPGQGDRGPPEKRPDRPAGGEALRLIGTYFIPLMQPRARRRATFVERPARWTTSTTSSRSL